jgi:hypothetical protein
MTGFACQDSLEPEAVTNHSAAMIYSRTPAGRELR